MKLRRPQSLNGLLLVGLGLVTLPLLVAVIWALVNLDRVAQQSEQLVFTGVSAAESNRRLEEHLGSLERVARQYQVLQNPDMHTVCMGVRDFETLDRFLALSGTKMARSEHRMLEDFRLAHNSLYCRHGCNQCLAACANRVPVSKIMPI